MWKRPRKTGLPCQTLPAFKDDDTDDDGDDGGCGKEIDWLVMAKKTRRSVQMIEDAETASKRLTEQGTILAENERYWEAIKVWNEALLLTPDSPKLHEMKSQALLEVGEVFPAVLAAEKAVSLDLTWATARQTLGRAQLGIGEVELALRNFQKAFHLDPTNREVREEDMAWALSLASSKFKKQKAPCDFDTISSTHQVLSSEGKSSIASPTRPPGGHFSPSP